MPTTPPPRLPGRVLWFLPFLAIAALFALAWLSAMRHAAAVRARDQSLVTDMLGSVQLVARMGRDIDRIRFLIEDHIFEHDAAEMQRLEDRIAATRADYVESARAYGPLSWTPGDGDEHSAWLALQGEVAAIRAPVEETLALSRANRNTEAHDRFEELDGAFDSIDERVARLIDINRTAADATVAQVDAQQRTSLGTLQALATAGLSLALIVGAAITRQVQRGEEAQHRYSEVVAEHNRDLDAFSARVAHDIRGPLATLSFAASRVARCAPHVPQVSETADLMRRNIQRIGTLTEDLLTLARVEGRVAGTCDPAAVASQIHEDFVTRIEREGGVLRVNVHHACASVSEGLLRQALANLTENAVKYRRPDVPPEIDIAGAEDHGRYVLRVSDNGIGMSPQEATQAFEPLYRSPRAQDLPGTGLGLSIVKRAVEASGGTVSVAETRIGEGTSFEILLPLASTAERRAEAHQGKSLQAGSGAG
jgi:signal transduction histidine kinase